MLTGGNLQGITSAVMEHVRPGQRCQLTIGLQAPVSTETLGAVRAELDHLGLGAQVDFGSTREWEHALRVQFIRPRHKPGISDLPTSVALVAALGAVGTAGIIAWKLGNIADSVARNLPWLLLAGGATAVLLYAIHENSRNQRGVR